MGSREEILTAIRSRQPAAKELPSLEREWITYPNRLQQFAGMLESIGGRCVAVANVDEINAALQELPVCRDAKQRISLIAGVGSSNVDLPSITDPHDLEAVDFAIVPGQLAVAENGAVWVTDRDLPLRALFFIVQHLSVVIRSDQIVNNMHEAYDCLEIGQREFGAFIAGPSKTADIEQSLVIGAHGPRSMTVFCIV
jgi:L-lactate dehydrogenase complex protein LldG